MNRRGFLAWFTGLISFVWGACMAHYPERIADDLTGDIFGPTGGTGPTGLTGPTGPTGPTGTLGADATERNTINVGMWLNNESGSMSNTDLQWTTEVISDSYYTRTTIAGSTHGSNDRIEINQDGLYKISMYFNYYNSSTTPSNDVRMDLACDIDDGFGYLGDGGIYSQQFACAGEEGMMAGFERHEELSDGDLIGVRIEFESGSGNMSAVPNHVLTIEYIRPL